MNSNRVKKLTFWGASPIIFLMTIFFAIPVIVVNGLFRSVFNLSFVPNQVLVISAIMLLATGIPAYVHTAKQLKISFKQQKLMTAGIFSLCRNPLFAEVIFLILPGIMLFFNSWLLLTIPGFMLIMFKVFIPREEALMEKKYGRNYLEYKNNTTSIFPKFSNYKKR